MVLCEHNAFRGIPLNPMNCNTIVSRKRLIRYSFKALPAVTAMCCCKDLNLKFSAQIDLMRPATAVNTTPLVASDRGNNPSAAIFVFSHPSNNVPASSGSNPFSNLFATFSAAPAPAPAPESSGNNLFATTFSAASVADTSASSGSSNPFGIGSAFIMTAIQTKKPPSVILQTINDHPDELRLKSKYSDELRLKSKYDSRTLKARPGRTKTNQEKKIVPVQLLPLHVALHENMPSDIIAAMLEKYPEAAREKDDKGRLPIRIALDNKASVEIITALLTAYPDAAKEKDGNCNMLPLHLACQSKAPIEVITALLTSYPEGAREKDFGQMLPLHMACHLEASIEIITTLLTTYPDAAREKDSNGRLPMHIACESGASAEVINSLLIAHPDGVCEKDRNGSTSLHSASRRGDVELVLLLLNIGADPNVKDNGGRTPRQVALLYFSYSYGQQAKVDKLKTIQEILERWPVLMTIKLLRKLRVFHWVDLSMMDLYEYIGQ